MQTSVSVVIPMYDEEAYIRRTVAAVRGVLEGTCDYELVLVDDCSQDRTGPRAIRLLEAQQADVLAGYRFDRTLEGLRRGIFTRGYHLLVSLVFGLRIRDVNFAFKLFRRQVLERVELKSEGSFIDAEFLVRAHRAGFRIIQMGLDYFPRGIGVSKLSSWTVILNILREMVRYGPELR